MTDTIPATVKTPAHTGLPWMVSPILPTFIMSADGKADICELDGWPVDYVSEENANREFIVRACNSHYQLIEALESANTLLTKAVGDIVAYRIMAGRRSSKSDTAEYVEAINAIDAALSQAGIE